MLYNPAQNGAGKVWKPSYGSIDFEIYRKTTNTDLYLWYSSYHPQYIKSSVASCLFDYAGTVAKRGNFGEEETRAAEFLRASGFSEHMIRSAKSPSNKRQKEVIPKYMYIICLPYVSGLSEDPR